MTSIIKNKIGVIGNSNYDEIFIVNHYPKPDDKVIAKDLKMSLGGGALNTIVGLSKLGVPSNLFSLVGDDKAGAELLSELKSRKIVTDFVEIHPGKTGRTIILLDDNMTSTKIGYQGVCTDLSRDLDFDLLRNNNLKHVHLVSVRISTVRKVLKCCPSATSSIDFGAKTFESDKEEILDVIQQLDLVFVNRNTFKFLFGRDIKTVIDEKLDFDADLIVTAGTDGMYAIVDNQVYHQDAALIDNVVDTTGAGDSAAAAILQKYVEGEKDFEKILRYGIAAATLKIQHYGGDSGHATRVEIEDFLASRA